MSPASALNEERASRAGIFTGVREKARRGMPRFPSHRFENVYVFLHKRNERCQCRANSVVSYVFFLLEECKSTLFGVHHRGGTMYYYVLREIGPHLETVNSNHSVSRCPRSGNDFEYTSLILLFNHIRLLSTRNYARKLIINSTESSLVYIMLQVQNTSKSHNHR